MERSRDRGCKGHRILRRVLDDGRHLGSCRASAFHEAMVTATLAASSRGKATKLERAKAHEGSAKALPTFRGRGRGDRGARGSVISGRRGKKTPTLEKPPVARRVDFKRQGSVCPSVIRRSVRECREALGPPINRTEPKTPWGVHVGESRVASRERTRYGCTQYHSGGRSRSDASRALPAGRSQGLVGDIKQGASQKEARSTT